MCSAFDLCPDPKNPTTIFYLPEQKKKDRALQQFKRRKVIGLLDVLRGIEMYIQSSCRKYRTNLPHSFFKTFLYYVIYSGSKRNVGCTKHFREKCDVLCRYIILEG